MAMAVSPYWNANWVAFMKVYFSGGESRRLVDGLLSLTSVRVMPSFVFAERERVVNGSD